MIAVVTAVALPVATLFVLVLRVLDTSLKRSCLLAGSFALGAGLGLSSCVFFLLSVLLTPGDPVLLIADIAFWAIALMLACLAARRRMVTQPAWLPEAGAWRAPTVWLTFALVAAIGLACAFLILRSLDQRHGEWDAWAIWNLRARFWVRGGSHWADAFSERIRLSHPGYPLLVTATVARLWLYAGSESPLVGAGVAVAMTLATAGLLIGFVRVSRDRQAAMLCGIVLLGTPFFLRFAASQTADVPLAFFLLAATALARTREDAGAAPLSSDATLAGLSAGLAAWTKNEGILFLAILVTLWFASRRRLRGRTLASAARFGAGVSLPLTILILFKMFFAAPTGLIAENTTGSIAAKLLDGARHAQIIQATAPCLATWGGWTVPVILPLLLVWRITAVNRWLGSGSNETRIAFGVVILMMAGYYLAYAISPYDLAWHIETSIDRVLVQVWPTFLLGCFAIGPGKRS